MAPASCDFCARGLAAARDALAHAIRAMKVRVRGICVRCVVRGSGLVLSIDERANMPRGLWGSQQIDGGTGVSGVLCTRVPRNWTRLIEKGGGAGKLMESGSEVRGGCTKLSGERWMSQMRDCGTGEL